MANRIQKRTRDKRRKISIQSAKAKGRRLQQWTAQKISDITGQEYGKDLDIDSRPMGQAGCDVILRGEAKKLFPFAVECKSQEKKSIPFDWVEQAKNNTSDFKTWLLFIKRKGEKPVVVMDADFFFELYKEFLELDKD